MRQQFPIYEKSSRWPYNPSQDPKFYRRFDVALKLVISAVIIGVTYLIIRPSADYEIGYLWWVVSIVGCIVVAMIVSRFLPQATHQCQNNIFFGFKFSKFGIKESRSDDGFFYPVRNNVEYWVLRYG